jgi:hypothetical protein
MSDEPATDDVPDEQVTDPLDPEADDDNDEADD